MREIHLRIGNKESGTVDNVSKGGIFSLIDIDTGIFKGGYRFENEQLIKIDIHFDTKEKIEGEIPYWDKIKEKVMQIGDYLVELEYLGFDIAVTDKGFKIIEINSFQGIDFFQVKYPLKSLNIKSGKYFKRKLKIKE